MRLDAGDIADLHPIIAAAVHATLAEVEAARAKLGGERLGYTESEAAAAIGVAKNVLRDCRLRGEIAGRLVGKRIVYSRAALESFLAGGGPRR